MSEKISLKMDVKLAASIKMDETLCWVLYIRWCKSDENELNYSQYKAIPIEREANDCE